MKKPRKVLVIACIVPFLTACIGTVVHPLPEPILRSSTNVRGVVLGDPESGERIEFSRVDHVEWTDSTLEIIGVLRTPDGSGNVRVRTFPLSDIGGVLVRGVDPNKTSILIAGVLVGATMIGAFLVTGKTPTGGTVF